VLDGRGADFRAGLELFARAADAPVRVCRAPGAAIDAGGLDGASVHEFAGPHPAGLPGTHMHFLDPAGPRSRLWVAGHRTVAAAGALLRTGRAPVDRVVALTGPMVARPRLVRTRVGASVDDLLRGGLADGPARVVAGSALSGRTAEGPLAYLGPDHRQVCVLSDAVRPRRLSWLRPAPRRPDWTTAAHGEPRPILPLRVFERVMPLDILPVPLLKALAVRDQTSPSACSSSLTPRCSGAISASSPGCGRGAETTRWPGISWRWPSRSRGRRRARRGRTGGARASGAARRRRGTSGSSRYGRSRRPWGRRSRR